MARILCPGKCSNGYHLTTGDGYEEWDECACCNPDGNNVTGTVTKRRLAAFEKQEIAEAAYWDRLAAEEQRRDALLDAEYGLGDPLKLNRLDPDERDLALAATVSFKPCPFCGRQPIVFHEQNDGTGLIVSRAACTGCHAAQHYCGRTKDEARDGVIAAWDRRITNYLDDCVVIPREPRPDAVGAWYRCKNNGGSDYDAYRALVASVAGK